MRLKTALLVTALCIAAPAALFPQTVSQVVNSIVSTTCTNQFVRAIGATGSATCASVASGDLSGSYTGITGTGTLTAGATGAGFTVALSTATVTGTLPNVNLGVPYFAANLSAAQTMTTASGPNLVNINTELLDSNGWYDNATNFRFTPQLAGKYRIHFQMECLGTTVQACSGYIYKNASVYARSLNQSAATAFATTSVDAIVTLNGSTDFVDARALITCTGTCQVNGGTGPIVAWIEGHFISP